MARLPKRKTGTPEDEIADPTAFVHARALLTPDRKPHLIERFSVLIHTQSLLDRKVIGSALPPVSKKRLLESAEDVARFAMKLKEAIAEFSKLGLPVSMSVSEVAAIQRDLVELPKLVKHVVAIQKIAIRGKAAFDKISNKRMIYPIGSPGEVFDYNLTELWQSAGHEINSSTGGRMAQFLSASYRAVTGIERESVSRPLGNALKYRESTQPSKRQQQIAGSARHKAAFDTIAQAKGEKTK